MRNASARVVLQRRQPVAGGSAGGGPPASTTRPAGSVARPHPTASEAQDGLDAKEGRSSGGGGSGDETIVAIFIVAAFGLLVVLCCRRLLRTRAASTKLSRKSLERSDAAGTEDPIAAMSELNSAASLAAASRSGGGAMRDADEACASASGVQLAVNAS